MTSGLLVLLYLWVDGVFEKTGGSSALLALHTHYSP